MKKNMTFEEFIQIFADYLGLDKKELTRQTNVLVDLGIDSLSLVNAMLTIEKDFQIKFRSEDRIMVHELGKIYEILIEILNQGGEY